VGKSVGVEVSALVGEGVDPFVGATVGETVGIFVEIVVGDNVGFFVGLSVGGPSPGSFSINRNEKETAPSDGAAVGERDGSLEDNVTSLSSFFPSV